MGELLPLLVVDAANVVGSVPDGWWRDRARATIRVRDGLVPLALAGVNSDRVPERLRQGPIEIVLVVEGAARHIEAVDGVRVVASPGIGDDTIVAVVRDEGGDRPCFVATADRQLSQRVRRLGAIVIGARTVRSRR